MPHLLGLDIGSNSVGSALIDTRTGEITVGVSIFPAGVDETEDKRGEPKNAERRRVRRTRITLARRAARKRRLRLKLIEAGLLPKDEAAFKQLLVENDPWELRRKALESEVAPFQFGRILLHLAQRRGALGLKIAEAQDPDAEEDGKVKAAITEVRARMGKRSARTFGEYMAMIRAERVTTITTPDKRPAATKKGPREFREPVRNKPGKYEHCADRKMIREEFDKLWQAQKEHDGTLAGLLTDEFRRQLDEERRDSVWKHRGLLFEQRMATWDLGTLGRCVLEPTERCIAHADMYASRYLVVETVNNLRIIEQGKEARPLTPEERRKIKQYLSGPLGMEAPKRGKHGEPPSSPRPKRTVSVTDLRTLMGWGRASKSTVFRFNIEADQEREINTDWFSREIIHGAVTLEKWERLSQNVQEGINRELLRQDPDDEDAPARLKAGVMKWGGLGEAQADALVSAWKARPRPDAKRLNLSRHAVINLLTLMDRAEPWPDPKGRFEYIWLTQVEARLQIAADDEFLDAVTKRPLDKHTRTRYATGAKGATARDRHYMKKHLLKKGGKSVRDPEGLELHEPPPAPLISNPVVRKAIHEVRRHVVEYLTTFECRPDEIRVELAREARMGKIQADRVLFMNRLRGRIRKEIAEHFNLGAVSSTQRKVAVDRVLLAAQQGCICPLCGQRLAQGDCGKESVTLRTAASGEGCELAHIIPKACGGHDGAGNLVLAHKRCNQDMGRSTPRQFWKATLRGGFDEGMNWIEGIYRAISRIKPSETKSVSGVELWKCYFARPAKRGNYFDREDDLAKIERFKKEVKDEKDMTPLQEAATKYASRQVLTYLADALFDGQGLPERGGKRRIFATDGFWTSRLREEWGLIFDPHQRRAKGLTFEEQNERQQKDRGDHRHHAIDAVIIALTTEAVKKSWDDREKRADLEGINTADPQQMKNYRKRFPLPPPSPYKTVEQFRDAIRRAVYGEGPIERAICHRPAKRKLVGALHKAMLYGAVVQVTRRDGAVQRKRLENRVTIRQDVLGPPGDFLKPTHLRLPVREKDAEAIERLTARFRSQGLDEKKAKEAARKLVKSKAFTRALIDPNPEKSGLVRDIGLRRLLRRRIQERGLDPESYTYAELKKSLELHGPLCHDSGVPIRRVVLLWSNNDPVVIPRRESDYATGEKRIVQDPGSVRLYDGQNNHHVEIRVDASGEWTGTVVTGYEVAQRKLARLRAFRAAGLPRSKDLRRLPRQERARWKSVVREIEKAHSLVDRSNDPKKGGHFVMSLCEGETLFMRRKGKPEQVGYFVVAKLDRKFDRLRAIVLVSHEDARPAKGSKDAAGATIANSSREEFSATPTDLKTLAPPGADHAVKVRVTPLGKTRPVKD